MTTTTERKAVHTPTPWTVDCVKTSIGQCFKIMPLKACLYDDHHFSHDGETQPMRDATHIVRCVNAHDELIGALEAARQCLDGVPKLAASIDRLLAQVRA